MNLFFSFVAALLLAGCASAPPTPARATNSGDTAQVVAPAVGSRRPIDTEAQRCLALAMYWEARGEGRDGMLAVGSVVLNRVDDTRFPETVCSVVHQGGETPPCQFSWWCDGKSDRPAQQAAWNKSLALARDLLVERPRDPTHGALFFHNTSINAPWRRDRTAQIGNHVFYR